MIRRTTTTLALAAALVVSGAGAASAHECYVANRSDKGNAGASNSANWYTLQVAELYSSVHFFMPELFPQPLTEAQVAHAVELTAEAGVPTSFTVFEKFTIPKSMDEASAKSSDGKGIDHFFTGYGEQLIGIALEASQAPA